MVITIARQFGSQGREIGKALSERLSIGFYDKELITLAAQQSGVSEEHFERYDEKATNSLLYTLSIGASAAVSSDYGTSPNIPINDRLYLLQHNIIRQAAEEPCVIVGRCADYVLNDRKDCVRVFICAPEAIRAERIARRLSVSTDKAHSLLKKTDKTRANYYNYYADGKWGDPNHYDLCLNSGSLSVEGCVETIVTYALQRGLLP